MKLRSRCHSSRSWHTLNLWFRLWLQQYPSNKLKHNNVVLSKSMGEFIDTFFVILQVNRKLKESWFILQYSTLKIKIKYLRNWKKKIIDLGEFWSTEKCIQKAELKRCTVLRSEARFRQACICIWKSNSSLLSAKGIAQGFRQQSLKKTFFFSVLKLMVLGLGKQTQHGEHLTKRKQGCIMIQFRSNYLNIKLQIHLRKKRSNAVPKFFTQKKLPWLLSI